MRPRASATLLILLLLASAGKAASQEEGLRGALTGHTLWSEVAGSSAFFLGGGAYLQLTDRLRIGGFGLGMLGSVGLEGGPLPENLRMGYGGVFLGTELLRPGRTRISGDLLLGAGNARVHAEPIGNQVGSDNFLVFEPRISLMLPDDTPLRGGLKLGYRLVAGVQDLPRVQRSDLDSWTLSAHVLLGGRE